MDTQVETREKAAKEFRRIDAHYVSHEIQHLFHLEKGFLFTVRELLLRPGFTVRQFLHVDRERYVKPIVFIIFTSLIFTLTTHYLHIEYSLFNIDKIEPLKGKVRSKEIGDWTDSHFGYMNLIISLFVGIWIKVLFKNRGYNIFETFIISCYSLGQAILIFALTFILSSIVKGQSILVALAGTLIYFIYPIWAVGQFFGEKKIVNYLKSALSYILGLISYLATLTLIAYLFKLLTH